ncbi:MAG: pyridoxal-phosphate dependent enzyme [Bacteroidota bacterium]
MLELPFEPLIQPLLWPAFSAAGVEVYIKREDLIHPFVSGNKWRKLKYVLMDARNMGKNTLVSFGGAYSNHLVALACAGAMYGFNTIAYVRGEEVNNHMLGLCTTWGMELRFVSREVYKNKQGLFNTHATSDWYFIDEGGRGNLAAKGCEEILKDVSGFTHVVCAIGTGTTFSGLAKAAANKGMHADGICVLKGAEEINTEIEAAIGHSLSWTIHHGFHGGGYAKTSPELWTFLDSFAQHTGILLDQVYTGKMLKAVIELVEQGYYQKGDKVLLIHTGGLLGLLSRYAG